MCKNRSIGGYTLVAWVEHQPQEAVVVATSLLARYDEPWDFSDDCFTHPIYSTGRGPSVLVLHELPGMTEQCLDLGLILAEKIPARVHLPLLFGSPGPTMLGKAANVLSICVNREINLFAANKTSPLVSWCRALCRQLRRQSGTRGVGVVGMCLTGGFALALVTDCSVLAPVVAQPSLPLFVHKAALGLSPEDTLAVQSRASKLGANCVLGLRYQNDRISPKERFNAIRKLIGPALKYIELPGNKHSTLTEHRDNFALDSTVEFLREKLLAAS